jgi:hypothetical protein
LYILKVYSQFPQPPLRKPQQFVKKLFECLVKSEPWKYHEYKDIFENTAKFERQQSTGADFYEYSDDDDSTINRADNDNPFSVRFDIYIVKIPWLLGIRGMQFRRISGDPWQYKNSCSIILDSLFW